ncbi:SCP2 sterol-binding domain-containing protein [Vannielia litorea]|uniref:SCP2 sterol-binding domain-containing protein n=1 Tax=Vannielia litorea TaxID=1217970 RepID=UPI00396572FF
MTTPLQEIADKIAPHLAASENERSLKFDCGSDGIMVLDGREVAVDDRPTDCTIRLSLENLRKLLKGELNPMTGVVMGKLRVSGNPAAAMELAKYLKA